MTVTLLRGGVSAASASSNASSTVSSNASSNASGPITIFFAGWGMDETPFASWRTDAAMPGTLILVDDHVMENHPVLHWILEQKLSETDDGNEQPALHVVGWSFGVRAAADWLDRAFEVPDLRELLSARKVVLSFVAGTLLPVDRTYGIPPAVAALTQKTLSPESAATFRQRMCGESAENNPFVLTPPVRTVESLARELSFFRTLPAPPDENPAAALARIAESLPALSVTAHAAGKDAIVPPATQERFWTKAEELLGKEKLTVRTHPDAPHGDFDLLTQIVRGNA